MLENPAPIPIDPLLDDNQTMLTAIQEWANSSEGQMAQSQNPNGYMAIRMQAQERQMALMPPPQAAPAGPPAQGGGGQPPPQGG
jgi:hypothetical protein